MWAIIDKYKRKSDELSSDGTVYGHVKTCKSKQVAARVATRLRKQWPEIDFKLLKTRGGVDLYADYYKYYGSESEKTTPKKTRRTKQAPKGEKPRPNSKKRPSRGQHAFRLGINGLDLGEALSLLNQHEIEIIFDARWNTFFKSNQGFGLENFKQEARKRGMKHLYVKSLGNPFHVQKELSHGEMKAKYMDYLDKKYWRVNRKDYFPAEKIGKLRNVLEKGARICFICYCKYPDPCHTYWILEKLLGMDVNKKEHALTALEGSA